MKCRVCKAHPVIELRQHNAAFCAEHFVAFVHRQVERAIDKFSMFEPDAKVLVAVSGGKDSLALWDILVQLGYDADGLIIGLGIDDYSERSEEITRAFAELHDLALHHHSLGDEYGFTVPSAAKATKRVPCSSCGLSKRHIFDSVAIKGGYDVVVTGHNLDDEAAVLFGNVMRWQNEYLARQHPVLPARNGFPRKTKPLIRLGEREMAAYCVLREIDYVVEECPMAAGNKHLEYKEVLNDLEVRSPGSKHAFYFGYLDRAAGLFAESVDEQTGGIDEVISPCTNCGSPSNNELCSFCRLVELAGTSVPVELTHKVDRTDT